jgi:hypothetical protein
VWLAVSRFGSLQAGCAGRCGRSVGEVARNDGRDRYQAHRADRAAWQQARRPQVCKLATNLALRAEGGGGSKPCNPKSPKCQSRANCALRPKAGGRMVRQVHGSARQKFGVGRESASLMNPP